MSNEKYLIKKLSTNHPIINKFISNNVINPIKNTRLH